MATEDRVKVLEGEFKLIKSELRQTLGSVRDFLLDLKLPPMQEEPGVVKETDAQLNNPEASQESPDGSSGGGDGMGDGLGGDSGSNPMDQMPDFSGLEQAPEGDASVEEPGSEEPADETLPPLDFDSDDQEGPSSGDMPGRDVSNEKDDESDDEDEDAEGINAEGSQEELDDEAPVKGQSRLVSTPRVNMLANIIRWVSLAKKEIGTTQLPVFLDVYSTTGNLSAEMKDIILHLAEVATNPSLSDESPENGQVISEQLKLCMEINRASGQLPEDIKFKIQRLTELLLQQSITYNKADVWSMLIVDLHGILSGGGATLQSLQSIKQAVNKQINALAEKDGDNDETGEDAGAEEFEDDMEREESQVKVEPLRMETNTLKGTRPARLRLVMPVGEGKEQELDLGNLFIATQNELKTSNSSKKSTSSRK